MDKAQFASTNILDYKVYSNCFLPKISIADNIIINTINAYSFVVAEKDPTFKEALMGSDILIPDGFPIVFAAKMLSNTKIKKIAGEDIFVYLMQLANQNNWKVMFLGSSNHVLEKIEAKVLIEYPNISISSFSPPFSPSFSEEDNRKMLNAIEKYSPDILLVGMTAPKQEKWVQARREEINAKVVCCIGAVFDFYAGTVKRPSKVWVNLRMEWFIRLIKEPKRLWKRYLIFSPLFFIYVFKAKFRQIIRLD